MRFQTTRWMISACLAAASLTPGTGAAQAQAPYFDLGAKAAQRESATPEARAFLVDVGSRLIAPGSAATPRFDRGAADVFLQFERALSLRERRAYLLDGVIFEQPMRGHTYRALVTRDAMRRLRQDPLFRGVEAVQPVDRLTRGLWEGRVHPAAQRGDGSMDAYIRFHPRVSLERARALLDTWGVRYQRQQEFMIGRRLEVNVTHGQALVLAEDSRVVRLDEVPEAAKTDNVVAAALSNIDDAQGFPFNLDGDGEIVGIWDGGDVRANHEQLTGRVTNHDGAGNNDHSTHVAGTMIADGTNNANALGMAPSVDELHSYDFNGAVDNEMLLSWLTDKIDFANHSWGTIVGWDDGADQGNANLFGLYNQTANDWDFLVDATDLLVQKSSGNDGNDCDAGMTNCDGTMGADGIRYHTIGTQGNAKNIITVGAVDGNPLLTGFSSTGPTDDNRIKPDLVAKGDNLVSSWAQGVTIPGGCDGLDYCGIGGTSMSTPTTTGGIVLMTELYREVYSGDTPKADVIKAVSVNAAQDLGRYGPDYAYGHGLFDCLAGVQLIQDGPSRIQRGRVDSGESETYLVLVPAGQPQLRVTAAWVDYPGAPDSTDPDLVNDLDVTLTAPNGSVFYPFSGPTGAFTDPATNSGPNTVDNVESIYVEGPQQGVWTVEVKGTSVPEGPQGYALVANAPYWLDTVPDIEVVNELVFDYACPGTLPVPEEQDLTIFNHGGGPLFINDVQLIAGQPDFELATRPSPPFVLAPGSHIDLVVRFDPQTIGIHVGQIDIYTNDPDEPVRSVDLSGLAAAPLLTATLESKGDFGDVQNGHFQLLELQVVNQGLCDLVLQDLQQVNGGPEFTVGEIAGHPNFPISLFPGEHVLIPFKYAPTDFGPDTALFNLATNDTKKPLVPIDLRGESSPPILTISGDFDFGEICPDEQPERTIQICNTGWSDLEVSGVYLGAPCDDFEIVGNPFPATVSHDFCMPLTVRYTPTTLGYHSCALIIQSNDPLSPTVQLTVSGTTLPVSIDVPPDVEFPATVIQEVYDCRSYEPFPVTNNGDCPVTITAFDIVQPGSDYSVVGLPVLPVTLLPGEALGEGQLQLCFAPLAVARRSKADVNVTYVSHDPLIGDTSVISRKLCGEAVRTGMRILVTENGVPVPQVHKIDFFRVLYPDTAQETLNFITAERFIDLVDVPEDLPCQAFQFHREWGGESDPIVLEPGTYRIWVRHTDGDGHQHDQVLTRYLDFCDFEGDFVVNFDV